jgi:hypothetical protein
MRAQPPTRKKYINLSNLSLVSKMICSNFGLECRVGVFFFLYFGLLFLRLFKYLETTLFVKTWFFW